MQDTKTTTIKPRLEIRQWLVKDSATGHHLGLITKEFSGRFATITNVTHVMSEHATIADALASFTEVST